MRSCIIGYSGAGKSTFAKRIAEIYQVPVLFLDTVGWQSGWVLRPQQEAKDIVSCFLDKNASWVTDGNWWRMEGARRKEEADTIFFFDFNRFVCLKYAWQRYKENKTRTRESMADGCDEKFDFEFFLWILVKGRTPSMKRQYREIVKRYNKKVIIFKNRSQCETYVKELIKKQQEE